MGLQRTPTWATCELHDFLMERAEEPFAWGKNDCCLFPADAILAMTGVDIAEDFRGKYGKSRASAMSAVRAVLGGAKPGDAVAWPAGFRPTVGSAVAWCAAKYGLEELEHPLCAQRGDLVVLANADGEEMGGLVGLSGREIVTVGPDGLVTFSIERVKRAWRV